MGAGADACDAAFSGAGVGDSGIESGAETPSGDPRPGHPGGDADMDPVANGNSRLSRRMASAYRAYPYPANSPVA